VLPYEQARGPPALRIAGHATLRAEIPIPCGPSVGQRRLLYYRLEKDSHSCRTSPKINSIAS